MCIYVRPGRKPHAPGAPPVNMQECACIGMNMHACACICMHMHAYACISI